MNKVKIRKTAVSGMFYEREEKKLDEQVSELLNVDINLEDSKIKGIIVPHAGYPYSGNIAGYAYKTLKNMLIKPQLFVIFGPSHHKYFKGITISDNEEFKTPIGNVKVNIELSKKLAKNKFINMSDKLDINEHSIEVQIPFIKKITPKVKIIPALVGEITVDDFDSIAKTFVDVFSSYSNVIFVASSDLSHFHDYETATKMDKKLIELLESNSITEIIDKVSKGEVEACGIIPILLISKILNLTKKVNYKNIIYQNSGDILPNDKKHVVGYTSGIFLEEE